LGKFLLGQETIRIISILHRQFAFSSTDRSNFIALNF